MASSRLLLALLPALLAGAAAVQAAERSCVSLGGEQSVCAEADRDRVTWWSVAAGRADLSIGIIEDIHGLPLLQADHSGRYLAVVSAEEGHPLLALYDLQAWLAQGQPPEALYQFDPYPGELHLTGWQADDPVLTFESSAPLAGDSPGLRSYRLTLPALKLRIDAANSAAD